MAASLGYRATFKAREERVRLESAKKEEEQLKLKDEISKKVQPRPDRAPTRKEPPRTEGAKEKKPPSPPPPPTRYEVKKEESLWIIAALKEVYNDPLLWTLIYKANRDQIKDPRQVFPGQVLAIPRSASPEDREKARLEARESEFFPAERANLPP
ncbi:MAG: LysM peptidoglycan-binding domain-containing protein [Desulfuromonadaceae bacterium]|nr:LysM peptidoglycan-binding domain-containing protein [Desulfuromonadaceae bacterium]